MSLVLSAPPSAFAKMRIRRALAQQVAFQAAQIAEFQRSFSPAHNAPEKLAPGTIIEFTPPNRRH